MHCKYRHKNCGLVRCRVAGCFSSFFSEDKLADHVSQVHSFLVSSDRVKQEEDVVPIAAVEFLIPELKPAGDAKRPLGMGQSAFKPFNQSIVTSASVSLPSSESAPAKSKLLFQSSLLRYFQ